MSAESPVAAPQDTTELPTAASTELQNYDTLSSSDEEVSPTAEVLSLPPISPQLLKQPKDATRLNTREAAAELQLRGLRATGFWGEDCKTLQACFDDEHRELLAQHHEQQRLLKEHEERERKRQERLRVKAVQRAEEERELNLNRHFKYWLKLAGKRSCPPDAAFETLNRCTCRLLAKVLPRVLNLRTLDLSNSDLDDKAGMRLVAAVKMNPAIQRLDLENTNIGVSTAQAIGHCFVEGVTLSTVCLDRNDLTMQETNWSGIMAIANGLHRNTSVAFLNMNNCCLGENGGKLLHKAMLDNSALLFLGYAGNRVHVKDEQVIFQCLERNKVLHAESLKEKKKEAFEQKLQEDSEQERLNLERKIKEEDEWLEFRKKERAAERQRQKELGHMRAEDAAMQNLNRLEQLEELERIKQAKRKKKKKGKKGKGKR